MIALLPYAVGGISSIGWSSDNARAGEKRGHAVTLSARRGKLSSCGLLAFPRSLQLLSATYPLANAVFSPPLSPK